MGQVFDFNLKLERSEIHHFLDFMHLLLFPQNDLNLHFDALVSEIEFIGKSNC